MIRSTPPKLEKHRFSTIMFSSFAIILQVYTFNASQTDDQIKIYEDMFDDLFESTTTYFQFTFLDADFQIELSNFYNSKNSFFQTDIIGNLAERIGRAKATTEQDLRMRNETLKQETYGLNLRKGMFDKQMEAQVTDWNDQDLNAFQSALLNFKSTQSQNVSTSLTNLRREQAAKDLESGQVGTLGSIRK